MPTTDYWLLTTFLYVLHIYVLRRIRTSVEFIKDFIDLFLHLDTHLNTVIRDYGMWTYLILFLIVFCETGW